MAVFLQHLPQSILFELEVESVAAVRCDGGHEETASVKFRKDKVNQKPPTCRHPPAYKEAGQARHTIYCGK